jgi:hypothetical protein
MGPLGLVQGWLVNARPGKWVDVDASVAGAGGVRSLGLVRTTNARQSRHPYRFDGVD